jgi:uncharacterized protein YjiK
MRFLKILLAPVFVFIIVAFSSCRHRVSILKSPPHYNFSVEFADKLELKLKEISGIVWDGHKKEFVAHNDESGKIFFLDKETKLIKSEFAFAGKGDYEDIAIANENLYVLRSDGVITKIFQDSTGKNYGMEVGNLKLSGLNDFETMYYDDVRKALILICKNCVMDNKATISAFAFYPDSTGFDPKPVFTINADEIKKMSPTKTSKFQPSAAAIHPILNKLFIVSSASNQLLIADRDGNPESVFHLSKKLFPQPEGITFKSNGDMYISNEGVASRSTLLKFLYKP